MSETTHAERRVERELVLEASPGEVWEAISEQERLAEWIADEVELDPVEGGEARFRFEDGEERLGVVERVEDGRSVAFTWERPGEGPSLVELTVEPVPAGTRLVVVESGVEAGPRAAAAAAWWVAKLGSLRAALALVAA